MSRNSDFRVLDLFCGLGGFSAAFEESDRWSVTTVDIEARFAPDIQADVFDLLPSDFEGEFDVVLASPPCTDLSFVKNLNGTYDIPGDVIALTHHTVGLITGLRPDLWILENPFGKMRDILGRPEGTVTYCQYGEQRMKPTDLWGDHPPMSYRRCQYGDDCHINHHEGSNAQRDRLGMDSSSKRAKVPYDLSESIREACTAALDGDAPEQMTVTEWSE